ncbi:helix-turn-helix transcriptional regulator [Flavobacterium sp.]|uniref:helix-turn-helix transcriptional regulator n=1 Tax=Flavobacterium sp. TaxID=239 RepID=UPI002602DF1A|nr:helix-turn-helix transcriptional regulator [Flavobacterium sp.]
MEIHEKIKQLREEKKLSQGYLAHELGLDQSQYSRREKGEIQFVPNEIVKLSKLLETSISNLFGEDKNVFTVHTQNGGNFGQYVTTNEKLIEQFELRIKEKEEIIYLLKQQLKGEGSI